MLDSDNKPWGVVFFVGPEANAAPGESQFQALAMAYTDQVTPEEGVKWVPKHAQDTNIGAKYYGMYAKRNSKKYNDYCEVNGCGETPTAFKACHDYAGGGYHNWYLPSTGELMLMFNVAQQFTLGSSAVPNTDFFNFNAGHYWSSTENHGYGVAQEPSPKHTALEMGFISGQQHQKEKSEKLGVRCVRPLS